jgi:hypothetical protein
MNKIDHFECEILDDGQIRSVTDPISPANHASSEQFFRFLAEITGGPVSKQKRNTKHVHTHTHEEAGQ